MLLSASGDKHRASDQQRIPLALCHGLAILRAALTQTGKHPAVESPNQALMSRAASRAATTPSSVGTTQTSTLLAGV